MTRRPNPILFRVALLLFAFALPACWLIPASLLERSEEARSAKPRDGTATLLWSDEFDGQSLDETKWAYRGLGPRRDAFNVREAVQLDGKGNLLLVTSRSGDSLLTGMIGTEPTFQNTFGYWEARMRFQKEVGHWSAFWLQSPTVGLVGDPRTNGTEIDIIEFLRTTPNLVRTAIHWDGYGVDKKSAGNHAVIAGLGEGYHRIGLEWTPEEYVFYVDDHVVWRTNQAVSHRPQYAILSLEVGPWAGNIAEATLPDTLFVDYVRVYNRR